MYIKCVVFCLLCACEVSHLKVAPALLRTFVHIVAEVELIPLMLMPYAYKVHSKQISMMFMVCTLTLMRIEMSRTCSARIHGVAVETRKVLWQVECCLEVWQQLGALHVLQSLISAAGDLGSGIHH